MAKKKNSKPIVYPVVFMVALTVFFGGALAGINALTKETIATQEALKVKENVLYVLGIPLITLPGIADIPKADAIEAAYATRVTERKVKDVTVFEGKRDDGTIGYAFLVNGPGLWGSMTGYVAVSSDLTTLLGMSIFSHSETPGLGGRIDEAWFKEQFRSVPIAGVSGDSGGEVVIFKPKTGGNVDAIAGATLTSEAVRVMLNEDILNFIANYGGDL